MWWNEAERACVEEQSVVDSFVLDKHAYRLCVCLNGSWGAALGMQRSQ